MQIKEKFKSIPQLLKRIFEKFPITMIAILLSTTFIAITLDTNFIKPKTIENIMFFILYFVSGSFLAEALFEKNNTKRNLSYIASAIISVILVIIHNIEFSRENIENLIWKISFCYVLTLGILSIYTIFKKSKKDFKEYLLKVFINMTKTSAIYIVLSIGISIVSAIFVYLIWEKIGYTLVLRLEILLLGFYYIPKLIYSLVDVDGEVNGFFKGLIKYVLTTLVIISFAIIYVYILKILILRDMPKNQIFRILSALFIIGIPIWTMMQHFQDKSIWDKISSKLPIAFIPFVFLQIYTIGIRIADNGFTPLRYICVALVLFEIVYILIYLLKREKLEILLLIIDAIAIISLIIPGINMFSISNMSQAHALKTLKNQSDYTDEEKERIYGAYTYLKDSEDGKKYINKILNSEDIDKIKSFSKVNKNTRYSGTTYINVNANNQKVEVEGYKTLYQISVSDYNSNSIEKAFSELKLEYEYMDSKDNIKVNLKKEFEKYIDIYFDLGGEELDDYFESHNEIQIEDSKKLIIKSFYLNYEEDSKLVKGYSIQGYLLEK